MPSRREVQARHAMPTRRDVPTRHEMPTRRDVLGLALGGGLALVGMSACAGPDESATTTTTAPPTGQLETLGPIRTVTPDAPAKRVLTLSSADLDVLTALGHTPTAAWAADGTGPRPWRRQAAPPAPEWDGAGPPSLKSLLRFGVDAFALAAADVSRSQLRAYEQLAAVIVGPDGRPGWRDHVDLIADAVDADPREVVRAAKNELETWAEEQRRSGVDGVVVVIGPGEGPDTPVATLDAGSPFGEEVTALGFEVISHPEPVPFRQLRRRGVTVVRVDPRDGDVVAAVRQPSVTSLPWALGRLAPRPRPRARSR